jgi:hypothetical protein
VIDDEDVHRTLGGFETEPELLLDSGDDGRRRLVGLSRGTEHAGHAGGERIGGEFGVDVVSAGETGAVEDGAAQGVRKRADELGYADAGAPELPGGGAAHDGQTAAGRRRDRWQRGSRIERNTGVFGRLQFRTAFGDAERVNRQFARLAMHLEVETFFEEWL